MIYIPGSSLLTTDCGGIRVFVLKILPWDHHTLQLIQVHFGVDFQADFEDVRWHDVALT